MDGLIDSAYPYAALSVKPIRRASSTSRYLDPHPLSLSLSLLGRAPPHVLKPGVGMWRWLGLELSNLLEASRHSLLDHVLIVV